MKIILPVPRRIEKGQREKLREILRLLTRILFGLSLQKRAKSHLHRLTI